ncbi:O-fucosyltransferase 27 [Bienertia sinuspersici]
MPFSSAKRSRSLPPRSCEGMTREALAYYGCAELFQDVHTELIQHKRSWMLKRGIAKGKLSVDSVQQRLNGSCPLMPEEVGIVLRAYGYRSDSVIYISGGEIFGGQRILIPLHAMFDNVVDRTSLSTPYELTRLYGREANSVDPPRRMPPSTIEEEKLETWKKVGPRPRPLPPPPPRAKYPYNIEGWWGWVAESDNEPESTVMELRTNAHKLLWEAIDYIVCLEADVFIPGFDRDGKGHPNFASLVMGHRLYQSAASVTYRPDRKEVVRLIDYIRLSKHPANRTWLSSIRKHLRKSLLDGPTEAFNTSNRSPFSLTPFPSAPAQGAKPVLQPVSTLELLSTFGAVAPLGWTIL